MAKIEWQSIERGFDRAPLSNLIPPRRKRLLDGRINQAKNGVCGVIGLERGQHFSGLGMNFQLQLARRITRDAVQRLRDPLVLPCAPFALFVFFPYALAFGVGLGFIARRSFAEVSASYPSIDS
jgi:hypothetical protein